LVLNIYSTRSSSTIIRLLILLNVYKKIAFNNGRPKNCGGVIMSYIVYADNTY